MANRVIATPTFERAYKRFSKKFKTLSSDLLSFNKQLLEKPKTGVSLGSGLYKARISSEDKNSGKSGGFRTITYLVAQDATSTHIYLLTMYDKSEESTIQKDVLIKLVRELDLPKAKKSNPLTKRVK